MSINRLSALGLSAFNLPCKMLLSIRAFFSTILVFLLIIFTSPHTELNSQCLTNGGFEDGNYSGWVVNDLSMPFLAANVSCAPLNFGNAFGLNTITPSEGSCFAYNGFDGNAGVITTCHECVISDDICSATFSFDYWVAYNLADFDANIDRMLDVTVDNGIGTSTSMFVYNAPAGTIEPGTGWINETFDLFSYIGQTVEICFTETIPEDMTGPALIAFDNVKLNTVLCSDCDFSCISQINVSLDDNCMAEITPGMVLANGNIALDYDIILQAPDGSTLPSNNVDISYLDQNLTYELVSTDCDNACWGKVLVEYKFLPIIDCPNDLTITCTALETIPLPNYQGGGNCVESSLDIYLADETRDKIECGEPEADIYTHNIVRTYIAKDSRGNETSCIQNIKLARIDLSNVQFPSTPSCISCSDENYLFNNDGAPLPWITTTGSGTASGTYAGYIDILGVPVICEPTGLYTIANSVCGSTGSGTGSGTPLIPSGGATIVTDTGVELIPDATALCNSFVSYSDQIVKSDCKTKIYRTWEIAEWYCGSELGAGPVTQLIEVKDNMPPTFDCPTAFTLNTSDDCSGSVTIPGLNNLNDQCGHGTNVKIFTPLGSIETNGGETNLSTGQNLVRYVVSDNCYNSATCEVNVTVRDLTMPVAICDQKTIVSINNSDITKVRAETFDDGSWDECGVTQYLARRMATGCSPTDIEFGPYVDFCCSDVGNEVMVVFRALDAGGNASDCMVSVEVQDKTTPSISCPANQVAACRSPYDLANLDLTFGAPVVTATCAINHAPDESINNTLNQCGVGTLTRTFEIRDGETLLASCQQVITLEDPNPFTASDIVWPTDYSAIDSGACGTDALDPQALALPYAYPTFPTQSDHCALLGYDYEDTVLGSGPCTRILREWTVIDWCQQTNGEFETYTNPKPQELILGHTEMPIISVIANPYNISTNSADCLSGAVNVTATVSTICTNGSNWSYSLFNATTGMVVDQGTESTFIDSSLVAGNYELTWTFIDGCNLSNTLVQTINISSNKPPTPVCMSNMTVTLDSGVSEPLTPLMLDAGSYHTCGHIVTSSFSSDGSINSMTFSCAQLGDNQVQLWVIDSVNGTFDFCTATVTVEQGDSDCTPQGNMAFVGGRVVTEELQSVSDVEVGMGHNLPMTMTNIDGDYAFGAMPLDGSYLLEPIKDVDHLNGVSTLDLILIQRHILGISTFESPYKYIAADIDNSQSVNGIDIVELRKLILGVYSELPSNTSWRFIDEDQKFQNAINPWESPLLETYAINKLESDMNIDFIGVKIGDVNGTVTSSFDSDVISSRSQRWPLILNVTPIILEKGREMEIVLTAKNYENISGWQAAFAYNDDLLEILNVTSDLYEIDESNYRLSKNSIKISIDDRQVRDISNGDHVVRISIKAKKDGYLDNPLALLSNEMSCEAYRGYDQVVPLDLRTSELLQTIITSVIPNPWVDNTKVEFLLSESCEARLEFYDTQGRELYELTDFYERGEHSVTISKNHFSLQGIIYLRLVTPQGVAEYKMIKM